MNKIIEIVGKVTLTAEGIWDKLKDYEELSVVTDESTGSSYLSKKPVPAGVDITNVEYWQPIAAHSSRNSNFIVLCDKDDNGELIKHTLESAVNSIAIQDRNPGLILGFYGFDYSVKEDYKTWFLYQYNDDIVDDWTNLDKWTSLYNNVNKFRGFFSTVDELIEIATRPTVGDYAFVGENMNEAAFYMCINNGEWFNTNTPAFEFANYYEAICSKDFHDLDFTHDESYADRAEKDAIGRIIHFTYITRDGLEEYVVTKILNYMSDIQIPKNSITLEHLTESVKEYLQAGGKITNFPDEEDLTMKLQGRDHVISFKDKRYSPNNFSGLGRKYLRKNMTAGINVLEPQMITEENTIYIIQYDYCMNDATIEIPAGCELRFEGGTINGGTLILNGTKITGVFTDREIGINLTIEGSYKQGQLMYDVNTNKYKYYNGVKWLEFGSSSGLTIDTSKTVTISQAANEADNTFSKTGTLALDVTSSKKDLTDLKVNDKLIYTNSQGIYTLTVNRVNDSDDYKVKSYDVSGFLRDVNKAQNYNVEGNIVMDDKVGLQLVSPIYATLHSQKINNGTI